MLQTIYRVQAAKGSWLPVVLCEWSTVYGSLHKLNSKSQYLSFNKHMCQNSSSENEDGCHNNKEISFTGLQYYEERIKFVNAGKEKGRIMYPHKFHVSHSAKEILSLFRGLEKQEFDSTSVSVAGRIFEKRESSKKLKFLDIIDDGTKLQIVANYRLYEEKENYLLNCEEIARGDIVGIQGVPMRTKAGELSVCAKKLKVLTPCLHMMPSTWSKLKNSETIKRSRYLDLLFNESSREKFILRSKIISYIRSFFEKLNFMEVETPVLNIIPGGANALPFKTYHESLDLDMFLRVAPELYLKMLIVGGFNRVFEVGRQFRNEGIDTCHNPEFTACEFYMAYADYEDMMDLTEKLISGLVWDIFGKYQLPYNRGDSEDREFEINFESPFQRIDFLNSIENKLNVSLPDPDKLQTEECREYLFNLCETHNIYLPTTATSAKMLGKLFENFVEPVCINPTFVLNYPKIMSPLAKDHRSKPGLTERFELFIGSNEICNAYTELNDPMEQRLRFQLQEAEKAAGDDEAQVQDENYVTALEYGLPPAGGWGMGIDRFVMVLTNSCNIRDVIFFPTMRPSGRSKYKSVKTRKDDVKNSVPSDTSNS